MNFSIKKICFNIIFHSSLFLILIIGIQNSSTKTKVNLLKSKSASLPIGFIIGGSFICGSIAGSFLISDSNRNND